MRREEKIGATRKIEAKKKLREKNLKKKKGAHHTEEFGGRGDKTTKKNNASLSHLRRSITTGATRRNPWHLHTKGEINPWPFTQPRIGPK